MGEGRTHSQFAAQAWEQEQVVMHAEIAKIAVRQAATLLIQAAWRGSLGRRVASTRKLAAKQAGKRERSRAHNREKRQRRKAKREECRRQVVAEEALQTEAVDQAVAEEEASRDVVLQQEEEALAPRSQSVIWR